MRILSISATIFFVTVGNFNAAVIPSDPSLRAGIVSQGLGAVSSPRSPELRPEQIKMLGDSADPDAQSDVDPTIIFYITRSKNLHTVVYR
jgi:hypothetical protein